MLEDYALHRVWTIDGMLVASICILYGGPRYHGRGCGYGCTVYLWIVSILFSVGIDHDAGAFNHATERYYAL